MHTSASGTPRRVLLPESGSTEIAARIGECVALVCPCRRRPQCGRDCRFRAQDDVLANLRADLLKQRLSLDRIGQSSTFHESVEAALPCMPTNAVKWSRMTATSSSSRFASSPSLVSCCSLGKLIRLSNAFSFSLRLCSALLSIRSCSRCLRSCSPRTASSCRRAAVSASRAFFSLSLMIATIKPCGVARGMRSRPALWSIHSRHSPGAS